MKIDKVFDSLESWMYTVIGLSLLIAGKVERRVSAHWAWALPVLLLAAALSMRQINFYPPSFDEYHSMLDSGWIINGPSSLGEIYDSLKTYAPNQVLGYHYLLNIWGWLAGFDIVLGRALGIFFGLLSLSIAYRLGRDFVAPIAGLFSIIILASNAFFNLYVPLARMYSLLFFMACLIVWLYLRMVYRAGGGKNRDCIALGLAVFAIVNIHLYSFTLLLALCVFHLVFVEKNRDWRRVIASIIIPLLLFMPYALSHFTAVMETADYHNLIGQEPFGSWNAFAAFFSVLTNGQPLLAVFSFLGLALSWHRIGSAAQRFLLLAPLILVILGALADSTGFVTILMRYHFPLWPFLMLFFSAACFGLHRMRGAAALLLLLWIISGLMFNSSLALHPYNGGLHARFRHPPWQLISRQAEQKSSAPLIIEYRPAESKLFDFPTLRNYSQREHYFDSKGITWESVEDPHAYKLFMNHDSLNLPEVWTVLQTSVASGAEIAANEITMLKLDYQLCETAAMGLYTRVYKHVWNGYNCNGLTEQSSASTDLIDYRFFGAHVDPFSEKLYFADSWSRRTDEDIEPYSMSYQLISSDWDNVAQLDLALVHENLTRRFYLDVSEAPAGSYRLMAILYDKHTGERFSWRGNDGDPPYMLILADVQISK